MNRDRVMKNAVVLTGVLLLLILMLTNGDGFSTVAKPGDGLVYQIYTEEKVPRTKADELLAADGMLYLYYEDFGLVNAYSTEGEYRCSYQVSPAKNGIRGIGYADGIFYLGSKVNGVFGFRGTESVYDGYPNEASILEEPNPVTDGGYTYYYNAEANQINRAKPGEALETVVQLPRMDGNVPVLVFLIGALWTGVAIWDKRFSGRAD